MKNSKWPECIRLRVIKSGISGWLKILSREINTNEPRYRHYSYNRTARNLEKENKKDTWYKTKGMPEDQPKACLIIDATPDNEFKSIFENEINKSELKIGIMERPGPKNQFALMATNNNQKPKCTAPNCLVCATDKGGDCRAKEVVYELKCQCGKAYDGQTGRNAMTRGKEHYDSSKSKDSKELERSVIFKHERDCHQGENTNWAMKVIKRFPKKPLDRHVFESLRIIQRPENESLNSKQEMAKSGLIRPTFISDKNQDLKDKNAIKKAIFEQTNKYRESNIKKMTTNETTPESSSIIKENNVTNPIKQQPGNNANNPNTQTIANQNTEQKLPNELSNKQK